MRLKTNDFEIRSKADLLLHRILGSIYYGLMFGAAGMMLAGLGCMAFRDVGKDNNWILGTGAAIGAILGIVLVWKNVFLSAPEGKNLEDELARLPTWATATPHEE